MTVNANCNNDHHNLEHHKVKWETYSFLWLLVNNYQLLLLKIETIQSFQEWIKALLKTKDVLTHYWLRKIVYFSVIFSFQIVHIKAWDSIFASLLDSFFSNFLKSHLNVYNFSYTKGFQNLIFKVLIRTGRAT